MDANLCLCFFFFFNYIDMHVECRSISTLYSSKWSHRITGLNQQDRGWVGLPMTPASSKNRPVSHARRPGWVPSTWRKKFRGRGGRLVLRGCSQSGIHLNTILCDPMRPRYGGRLCVPWCSAMQRIHAQQFIGKQHFVHKNKPYIPTFPCKTKVSKHFLYLIFYKNI